MQINNAPNPLPSFEKHKALETKSRDSTEEFYVRGMKLLILIVVFTPRSGRIIRPDAREVPTTYFAEATINHRTAIIGKQHEKPRGDIVELHALRVPFGRFLTRRSPNRAHQIDIPTSEFYWQASK